MQIRFMTIGVEISGSNNSIRLPRADAEYVCTHMQQAHKVPVGRNLSQVELLRKVYVS